MRNEDQLSYMMLFCGLLLAQQGGTTMDRSLGAVPLVGGARRLAIEILSLRKRRRKGSGLRTTERSSRLLEDGWLA